MIFFTMDRVEGTLDFSNEAPMRAVRTTFTVGTAKNGTMGSVPPAEDLTVAAVEENTVRNKGNAGRGDRRGVDPVVGEVRPRGESVRLGMFRSIVDAQGEADDVAVLGPVAETSSTGAAIPGEGIEAIQ